MPPDGGSDPFDDRWIRPRHDGDFDLDLPGGIKAVLREMLGGIGDVLRSDSDAIRRVFPTAYPDDPDREAGYQVLIRGELIDRHIASAAVIESTLDRSSLTEAELNAWLTAVNALRLVLGTILDVSEDDELAIDPDEEDAPARMAYHVLGDLLHDIVLSLRTRL